MKRVTLALLGLVLPLSAAGMSRPSTAIQPGAPVPFGGQGVPPPVVRGVLTKDVIRRVIYVHINEIRNCYQHELQMRPGLAGRLVVSFHIDAGGQVDEPQIGKSTLKIPSLHQCIGTAVSRWEFPATNTPGTTEVIYPFVLRPRVKEQPATGVQITDEDLARLGIFKDESAPDVDIVF